MIQWSNFCSCLISRQRDELVISTLQSSSGVNVGAEDKLTLLMTNTEDLLGAAGKRLLEKGVLIMYTD